jgi:hypothetical protein
MDSGKILPPQELNSVCPQEQYPKQNPPFKNFLDFLVNLDYSVIA